MSFKAWVTDGSGYATNGLAFETAEEAEGYAHDLMCRWLAAVDFEIRESDEEVNKTWPYRE